MSDNTQLAKPQGSAQQTTPENIPCLMIPLAGRSLLVPTVTVAEMVSYKRPEPVEDSPEWLLGVVEWRNQRVPVLSFEVLNGEANPGVATRSRLAVFNNTGVSEDLPFIAVVSQAIPKLVRVTASDIDEADIALEPFDRMWVDVEGEQAVIPDVSALEQLYVDWLAQA